jgi:hypothetical protein
VSACYNTSDCQPGGNWTNNGGEFGFRSSYLTANVSYNISAVGPPIESVQVLSAPTPQTLSPSDLLHSFNWVFGNQSNEIETPRQEFSSNSSANFGEAITYIAKACVSNTLTPNCGILFALPLLVFQPISTYLSTQGGSPNSLIELVQNFSLPSIPVWSVLVYFIVSAVIFFWSVGAMVLALFVDTPSNSNFDAVDFAARIIANHSESGSLTEPLLGLSNGRDAAIQEALQDKDIFVRDVAEQTEEKEGQDIGKIGFTMNDGEGKRLLRGALYA